MSEEVKQFYDDLRKVVEAGKLVVFFGAGACHDYGIPTMDEMALLLANKICSDQGEKMLKEVEAVLLSVLTVSKEELEKEIKKKRPKLGWNLEDLLTRLFQIRSATQAWGNFAKVEIKVGNAALKETDISAAEKELLDFLVKCLKLDGDDSLGRKRGSVDYIGRFIQLMGEFADAIRIFTTNNDLCIEAAIAWVSQQRKKDSKKGFRLVDGFSHGLVPTFAMENFAVEQPRGANLVPFYLWKMHGSIDWVYTNPQKPNGDHNKDEFGDESVVCKKVSDEIWKQLIAAGALNHDISDDAFKIMIFPTPGKYSETYSSPYMDLYEAFRRTLQEAEFLLAVGTSFPDKHINSAIKAFLRRDNTHLYLVDPNLSPEVLHERLGEHDTIKPVIKMGFKEFVEALERLEQEEESSSSATPETQEDKNE